jgi:type I restriction enzyme S subunit
MKFGLDDKVIEHIQKVFQENWKVDFVVLFGSRAKGNHREGSDIDLAAKGRNVSYKDILALNTKLDELNLPYEIDLLDYAAIKDEDVIEHIDRAGIVLYKRWKEYKLGDIAKVQTGPFGSQLHMSDYKVSGTPIITVEHLGDNKILHTNLPLVSKTDKERLNKYLLQEGDIVFSRVGSVDRSAYVSKNEDGWMFSGRCLRVRVKSKTLSPKFLSYVFQQENFKENIRRIAVGATMPSINTDILSNVSIAVPPFKDQDNITSILSSLDDKIDLLRHQNKTLEQLAETLFRQWFVENASKDWEVGKLGDLVEFIYGKALKEESRSGNGFPVIGSSGVVGYHSNFLVKAPGIVIGRKGTLGKTIYLFENFSPIDTTYYIKSKLDSKNLFYEYFLLKSLNFEKMNSDSAVPGLNRDIALSSEVILPSLSKIALFNNYCSPFFKKIETNINQIRSLIQFRDILLHKLMSGEMRMKQII